MSSEETIKRVEELARGKITFDDIVASVSLDDVLEASPDGVILADKDGTIIYTNKQARMMFHYPRGGMLGAAVETLIPERFRVKHVEHRTRHVRKPIARMMGSFTMPLFGLTSDGDEIPLQISLSHVYSSAGLVIILHIRERDTESTKPAPE